MNQNIKHRQQCQQTGQSPLLDQTAARCIQVDLWSEVALVAFLIVMFIVTGLLNKKNGLRALNVTSFLAIPFCLFLIGWYCYCFYVVANTLSVFESYGVDCGRLTPYMISLGVIGIITKIILILLLSMRPAQHILEEEDKQEDPNNQHSEKVIGTTQQQF